MAAIAAFADFVRSGGTLFLKSRSSAPESNLEAVLSKTERLREIWQKTTKVRMGVGIALMAWSAVAASSWAFAVVGWIAAIRAWMAWTGAFLAVDGMLRSLGIQKNAATVALAVGVSVAAIMSLPAAETAEVFTSWISTQVPGFPYLDSSPIPPPHPEFPTLPFRPIPPALTSDSVREIFSDIRSDHPNQGFVTLEQSVRRIEWLGKGVPLTESARLPFEIPNAHSITLEPSWKIAKAMEKFWFLSSESLSWSADESRLAIDSAARKLTVENMEKILIEAYGNVETESVASPVVVEGRQDFPVAADATLSEKTKSGISGFGLAALFSVPIGIAAYLGFRRRKKTTDCCNPEIPPRNTDVAIPNLTVPLENTLPNMNASSVSHPPAHPRSASSGPVYPALSLAVSDVLASEYGFESVTSDIEPAWRAYRLPTAAWEFVASVGNSDAGTELRFTWTESGKTRHVSTVPLVSAGEPDELRDSVRKALEGAYFEMAVVREKVKSQEFRDVRIFEVPKRDFAAMYRQLEDPATASSNRETGGFWFWSGYGVKDGVFRFGNLANPAPEQIDSTSVEFAIRGEHWERYVSTNLSKAFRADFLPGERKLFLNAAKRAERENPNVPPFPLALDFFNWHKHPGAPLGPSGGDINHPDSASGKFEDSPLLPVVTFAIANKLNPHVRIAGEGMTNSHVLKGSDFGGGCDYFVTFWKLLRISDAERVRREAFISKVWKSKAASLGICDRNGRLLHLDRDVRTGEGVFEADLRPVGVRESVSG